MTTHKFIFSDKPTHRVTRHLVFWLIYSWYFWLQSITASDIKDVYLFEPYKNALISLCCFLPTCILSAYIFVYALLPDLLEKRKYYLFGLSYIAMYALVIVINRLSAEVFLNYVTYQHITEVSFITPWGLSTANTMWAFSIAIIAMGIKLSKNRYLQHQENLGLIKKKSDTELSYQKALLRPEFLAGKLDDIYTEINTRPANAPEMVLKLSDLLSYMLYEGNIEQVPLEKELSSVKDFIFLEQAKQNKSINIQLRIEGDANSKFVDPLLILNLVQASVSRVNPDKHGCYDIDITIETNIVIVEILFNDVDDRNDVLSILSRLIEEKYNQISLSNASDEVKIQPILKFQKSGIRIQLPLFSRKNIQYTIPGVQAKPLSYELE